MLKELNINIIKCIESSSQIKSRYWLERGDGLYKVLQINETKALENSSLIFSQVNSEIDFRAYDKVIVSDYRLGLLSRNIIEMVAKKAKYFGGSQMSDKEPNLIGSKNLILLFVIKRGS